MNWHSTPGCHRCMLLTSSQITWERNPQALGAEELKSRMRAEGASMLTQILKVPPEQVRIDATGVVTLKR